MTSNPAVDLVPAGPDTSAKDRGCYVDLGRIASGGMACVHFGRMTGYGGFSREVAIKRLHRHLTSDPEFVAMLLDEARLAGRIAHTNVVQMLDVLVASGDVVVVMEYVRGLPLSQVVKILEARGDRMPLRVVSSILVGVLHGLHAAHEATDELGTPLEIVHRDVSPQNVVVGIDGVPRLLDFGIAKATARIQTTRDGDIKGKIAYMSPEQAQGGCVTRRSDIYAAGIVLWELVTGLRLCQQRGSRRVLAEVSGREVEAPSAFARNLPPGLDRVHRRAMAMRAEGRYPTARAMAMDLNRCVPGVMPSEVADWLAHIGREALAEQSKRLADLERRGAERILPRHGAGWGRTLIESPPLSAAISPPMAPPSTTAPVTLLPRTALADAHERTSVRDDAVASAPERWEATTLRVTSAPPPVSGLGDGFRKGLSLALALGLIILLLRLRLDTRSASSNAAPAEHSAIAAVGAPSASSRCSCEARATPRPTEPPTSAPSQPLVAPLVAASSAAAFPPPPAGRQSRPAKCIAASVDSTGHVHFNPACL